MTADLFDLGARLAAADTGTVTARLVHTPVSPSPAMLAVHASHTRTGVQVSAATPGHPPETATGPAALDLLDRLGATLTAPEPTTLLHDHPGTLAALRTLAVSADPTGPGAAAAGHIGWWLDRADFPGGRAVLDVPAACRTRWVCGTDPAAERTTDTWRTWLHVPDEGVAALLALYARLRTGPPLAPHLLGPLASDDVTAYQSARTAFTDGRDWRTPDSTARAALGLRSRCDAADLYAAALLTDPLHRTRAVHTGHVITGTITTPATTSAPGPARATRSPHVQITCARLDARVKVGTTVTGWIGTPATTGAPTFTGQITATAVHHGHLVLTLGGIGVGTIPTRGAPVTLHESGPTATGQAHARAQMGYHYNARRSWLTTGRPPTPTRRNVPLAVLIAGATDEPPPTPDGAR